MRCSIFNKAITLKSNKSGVTGSLTKVFCFSFCCLEGTELSQVFALQSNYNRLYLINMKTNMAENDQRRNHRLVP